MRWSAIGALLLGVAVSGAGAEAAVAASTTPAQKAAVSDGAALSRTDAAGTEWICRPGTTPNPCLTNENALVVQASGTKTLQRARPAANPPIDCFYVMPTVSGEPGLTANLKIQTAETGVAKSQASRFSAVCKVYAPMYPQITVNGLAHAGSGLKAGIQKGYAAVQAAWQDYMAHYTHGRGVVVIGHSQGSTMAQELLRTQVDPKPSARSHLVSAIIPGGNVVVPVGQQVGGTFQHLAACRTATALHCVIAYSSFDQTPPSNTLFGRPGTGVSFLDVTPGPTAGMMVLCVNPANLTSGGSGLLQPYFPSGITATTGGALTPWLTQPRLYSGQCQYQNGTSWLQVTAPVTPGDPRSVVTQSLGPSWGLHIEDINLYLGNLVSLVQRESAAYALAAS
jgi:hypothetical protein